jgi:hypothetical protein
MQLFNNDSTPWNELLTVQSYGLLLPTAVTVRSEMSYLLYSLLFSPSLQRCHVSRSRRQSIKFITSWGGWELWIYFVALQLTRLAHSSRRHVLQVVKPFCTVCGTRKFVTMFTKACQETQSQTSWIHSFTFWLSEIQLNIILGFELMPLNFPSPFRTSYY